MNSEDVCDKYGQAPNGQVKHSHKGVRHQCRLCEKSFKAKCTLEIHIRLHTGELPFSCNICPKSYASRGSLNGHLKIHLGAHKCETCDKKFPNLSMLTRHIITHSDKRPFECEKCKKSFTRKYGLVQHEMTHNSAKPYGCPECSYRGKLPVHVRRHLKIHQTRVKLPCPMCSATLLTKGSLTYHMRRYHGTQGEKRYNLECVFCEGNYRTTPILYAHVRSHIQEKPYLCEICGKESNINAGKFDYIRRRHTMEKTESCGACGKLFTCKSGLVRHLLIHAQNRETFPCKKCSKYYVSRNSLNRHNRRTHQDAQLG